MPPSSGGVCPLLRKAWLCSTYLLQCCICVLVARPRRCPTSSNPVLWQNWMAAYLCYTLRMKMLFRAWPVMGHDTHTRRRRLQCWSADGSQATLGVRGSKVKVTRGQKVRLGDLVKASFLTPLSWIAFLVHSLTVLYDVLTSKCVIWSVCRTVGALAVRKLVG